jgi:hypothetical protein
MWLYKFESQFVSVKKKKSGQQGHEYKGGLQYFILCFEGYFEPHFAELYE